MKIYKEPKFENDSYMFVIEEHDILEMPFDIKLGYNYLNAKYKAFKDKDINKKAFESFNEKPSFYNLKNVQNLEGSIYTHTCEGKNKLDYNHIIKYCKKFYKVSRRCAINFADTLHDNLSGKKDVSCLNSIHFYQDNVTLYFRASDIKNELLLDLHLIIDFFIKPVGDFKTITVMASTAQNVETKLSTLIQ